MHMARLTKRCYALLFIKLFNDIQLVFTRCGGVIAYMFVYIRVFLVMLFFDSNALTMNIARLNGVIYVKLFIKPFNDINVSECRYLGCS